MTRLDTTVVSAIDPCLQIREDKMDHRQVFFRLFWVTAESKSIVLIANLTKPVISLPAISQNDRASRYIIFDECCECIGVATRKRSLYRLDAGNDAKPKSPFRKFVNHCRAFGA